MTRADVALLDSFAAEARATLHERQADERRAWARVLRCRAELEEATAEHIKAAVAVGVETARHGRKQADADAASERVEEAA